VTSLIITLLSTRCLQSFNQEYKKVCVYASVLIRILKCKIMDNLRILALIKKYLKELFDLVFQRVSIAFLNLLSYFI